MANATIKTKKILKTRELPVGCKVKTEVTIDGVTSEQMLTYRGMDGMYGKFLTEKGEICNATGKHKKEKDYYIFI